MSVPTTATALSRRTTWLTPLIVFAWVSSTPASVPPNTGQVATVATRMPGSLTSMLYCAVPFTLARASRRLAGVPISLNCAGPRRSTAAGTGRVAAVSTSSPYVSVRFVGTWITAPFSARQDVGSTCHVRAAAATSIVRAVAPARRSGAQAVRTDVEAPVAWNPRSAFP